MADTRTDARRRRWADVVIIVAGVYALLMAVWPGPPAATPDGAVRDTTDPGVWWWIQALGAGLALASLAVATRSATAAKVMAGAGGLVLIAGLLTFQEIGWLAIRTAALPGIAILIAAPFMGAMPSPEEEGKPRSGLGAQREP